VLSPLLGGSCCLSENPGKEVNSGRKEGMNERMNEQTNKQETNKQSYIISILSSVA